MSNISKESNESENQRLLRIEEKIDAIQENLNKLNLTFQKQVSDLDKRLAIIEEYRQYRWSRRDIMYLAMLIATWLAFAVMLLKP